MGDRGAIGIQEIIIVMVVTGILLGLGVFSFQALTDSQQTEAAISKMDTVVSAVQELGAEEQGGLWPIWITVPPAPTANDFIGEVEQYRDKVTDPLDSTQKEKLNKALDAMRKNVNPMSAAEAAEIRDNTDTTVTVPSADPADWTSLWTKIAVELTRLETADALVRAGCDSAWSADHCLGFFLGNSYTGNVLPPHVDYTPRYSLTPYGFPCSGRPLYRDGDGRQRWCYDSSTAANLLPIPATTAAKALCQMVKALNDRTPFIQIEPYNEMVDGKDCSNFDSAEVATDLKTPGLATTPLSETDLIHQVNPNLDPSPSTFYVTVNLRPWQGIPPGGIARIVGKPDNNTTLCAVLVRSGPQVGIGWDSWTVKTAEQTDASTPASSTEWGDGGSSFYRNDYEAHCPATPLTAVDFSADLPLLGPPRCQGNIAAQGSADLEEPDSTEFDTFYYFPVLPDPDRPDIHVYRPDDTVTCPTAP